MGASKEFLQTMISHRQKQLYLKLELLDYNKSVNDFVVIDTQYIEQKLLPNGISVINGNVSINTEQDVRTILDLEITNHTGVNNWGADFNNLSDFKWWLDKRIKMYLGLVLDDTNEMEYIQLGYFIITYFETLHNLTEFPVTRIQCSSKEVLYASRRGKFVSDVVIQQGTVMTDAIKSLLIEMGEKEEHIKIDPDIANESIDLEDGEGVHFDTWSCRSDTKVFLDYDEKAHGKASLRFELETNNEGIFATKNLEYPIDMTGVNAIAIWCRSSRFIPDSKVSIWLTNQDGKKLELSWGELVGNIVDEEEVLDVNTWRKMILRADGLKDFNKVIKMELNIIDNNKIKAPLKIWIDEVYCAEVKNLLKQDLTYGAGDNSWNAIKELADLLDCDAYYDDYGNFILRKRKYPQEMNTNEDFEYDAYDVLEPVITYSDRQVLNNLYAGCTNQFDEHELANHVRTAGGNTSSSVVNIADIQLTEQGLEIREKGKVLNAQGKVRSINQFPNGGDSPTILNGDTDVSAVWEGHKNHDAVVVKYPNGFPHLTQPPIRNFNIQRIGDFLHLPNNASPIPTIQYTYEAKNRSLYELRKHLSYSERINLTSIPFYVLRGNDIVKLKDSLLDINENFEVISINIPLNGDYMNLTLSKIENLIIDVPYFDPTGQPCNACWYHYDFCNLAFPYAWQVDVFQMNDIFDDIRKRSDIKNVRI